MFCWQLCLWPDSADDLNRILCQGLRSKLCGHLPEGDSLGWPARQKGGERAEMGNIHTAVVDF